MLGIERFKFVYVQKKDSIATFAMAASQVVIKLAWSVENFEFLMFFSQRDGCLAWFRHCGSSMETRMSY
ncbi:hypothetical protein BO221_50845 [Archangium sp. Cb G35]|nr:hypothetical protein BO221_50845 [Archangium sp. Cb G35]